MLNVNAVEQSGWALQAMASHLDGLATSVGVFADDIAGPPSTHLADFLESIGYAQVATGVSSVDGDGAARLADASGTFFDIPMVTRGRELIALSGHVRVAAREGLEAAYNDTDRARVSTLLDETVAAAADVQTAARAQIDSAIKRLEGVRSNIEA